MEIIGADGSRHEYPLGPQEPRLRPCDVELLHKVWLEITADPRYAGLHHYDVVALALEELKRTLNSKGREALLQQFNSSVTEIAKPVRYCAPRSQATIGDRSNTGTKACTC